MDCRGLLKGPVPKEGHYGLYVKYPLKSIEQDDGEQAIPLSEPGAYAIAPRGLWHTAKVSEPSRLLFITPGEGTEHREIQLG